MLKTSLSTISYLCPKILQNSLLIICNPSFIRNSYARASSAVFLIIDIIALEFQQSLTTKTFREYTDDPFHRFYLIFQRILQPFLTQKSDFLKTALFFLTRLDYRHNEHNSLQRSYTYLFCLHNICHAAATSLFLPNTLAD
jgi:hypothetical protein